jgi:hypothetical protein
MPPPNREAATFEISYRQHVAFNNLLGVYPMSSEQNKNNSLPFLEDFFLKNPLYKDFQVDIFDDFKVQDVKNFKGTIDAFCIKCKKSSTFRRVDMNQREYEEYDDYPRSSHESNVFCVSFACTRNENHNMYFYFMVHDSLSTDHDTVTKIGQYPSLADLNSDKIKKYRKILGDKYEEFSRAVGLASHGVGIGSFVYLRRIFENLIEEAHQEAIKTNSCNEDDYRKSRMDERIELLKDSLPDFLVENKVIYSILSKGIHELSENECLKYFDPVKIGIELILDEKLEKLDREAKIKEAKKSLSEIHSELK